MEEPQSQNQTNMVWYNYAPVDGVITSGSPVQVEIGGDISRQLNQVQIQYGSNIATLNDHPHIILSTPTNENITEVNDSFSIPIVVQQPKSSTKTTKSRGGSTGERVPCCQCGKTFSCNANLRDHMRLHTGERPFSCSECGLSFAQRSNWRLHKRVHTGEKPYMCGICGKTFARSSHLPGHMRVHTGERPYSCDRCDQSFTSGQALKNHNRTHTGEKPFICQFCQTPFTHSSSLSSHKKRCTGEKRKRGRPLGTRCILKKKVSVTRPRGRPKKHKKKAKKLPSNTNISESSDTEKVFDDLESQESCEINEDDAELQLQENMSSSDVPCLITSTSLPENDLIELSVEVINEDSKKNSDDLLDDNGFILGIDSNEPIEQKFQPLSLDHKYYVTEDIIEVAAASVNELDKESSLHQEAAVTMTTLQHGSLSVIHHKPQSRNNMEESVFAEDESSTAPL